MIPFILLTGVAAGSSEIPGQSFSKLQDNFRTFQGLKTKKIITFYAPQISHKHPK